jgi:hypothetical protein
VVLLAKDTAEAAAQSVVTGAGSVAVPTDVAEVGGGGAWVATSRVVVEDAGQAAVQTVMPFPQSVRAVERQQPARAEVG